MFTVVSDFFDFQPLKNGTREVVAVGRLRRDLRDRLELSLGQRRRSLRQGLSLHRQDSPDHDLRPHRQHVQSQVGALVWLEWAFSG